VAWPKCILGEAETPGGLCAGAHFCDWFLKSQNIWCTAPITDTFGLFLSRNSSKYHKQYKEKGSIDV